MNPNSLAGETPIALYDMSIEDVEERKNKRLTFPTTKKAAAFLGYNSNEFYERMKPNNYGYKRGTNQKFAIRRISNEALTQTIK